MDWIKKDGGINFNSYSLCKYQVTELKFEPFGSVVLHEQHQKIKTFGLFFCMYFGRFDPTTCGIEP